MMECVGAIDQGTQSSRFVLYDGTTKPIASHQVEFPQLYPKPGWCEHDPAEIWNSVVQCIGACMKEAQKQYGSVCVKSIGVTNQRETTVVWDRATGKPLYNAIVWMDGRTSGVCKDLERELGSKDYFRSVTGLPISTYFSGVKLKWLVDNVPNVKQSIQDGTCCFGTIDSWLIYNLTGGSNGGIHITDVSNASRTLMMDIHTCSWHKPFLHHFGADMRLLPRICSNSEVYGVVQSGPLKDVPITGSLGDQQAAMLGQRCKVGEAKNTYGTGCFMLLNTGTEPVPSTHGLLTTIAFRLGPDAKTQYALEGSVAIGGAVVSWLRDKLGVINSASESESVASEVEDTGGVYFVPAFSGLLAPYWEDSARGTIIGLTGYSTRAHIVRAGLEAICFQTCDVLESMKKDAKLKGLVKLKVDGGAVSNNLLLQMQADLLQIEVARPENQETTALGAAIAAGLSVGFYDVDTDFESCSISMDTFTPKISVEEAASRYSKWGKAIQRSMNLADLAPE